ncbi:hypothetical protein RhiirA5_423800 [Rhizophagus irregularis]|uniref:Uncharacterized protein n=1 Tax=Rhizophagus irregularis TaxID=588596 RepID=A0A2N0P9D4_9GLOM|nr:hypothetical protein RhiirA5_423800 [Rhizophagus irregularis]
MYQLLVKIHLKKQKVFEEIFQHTLRCCQEAGIIKLARIKQNLARIINSKIINFNQ